MVIVAPNQSERARVVAALNAARIQSSLHYPCLTDFTAFQTFRNHGLEKSRAFASRVITLPLYPDMSAGQVEEVCAVVASA